MTNLNEFNGKTFEDYKLYIKEINSLHFREIILLNENLFNYDAIKDIHLVPYSNEEIFLTPKTIYIILYYFYFNIDKFTSRTNYKFGFKHGNTLLNQAVQIYFNNSLKNYEIDLSKYDSKIYDILEKNFKKELNNNYVRICKPNYDKKDILQKIINNKYLFDSSNLFNFEEDPRKNKDVKINIEHNLDMFSTDKDLKRIYINFANKYAGGGVLHGAAVQEELMFYSYPELLIYIYFCKFPMEMTEMVIIENLKRYCKTNDKYGKRFREHGTVDAINLDEIRFITQIAIEAKSFTNYSNVNINHTYVIKNTFTDLEHYLIKLYLAFVEAPILLNSNFSRNNYDIINTGKWGGGAFNNDSNLNYFLQCLIASMSSIKLSYFRYNQYLNDYDEDNQNILNNLLDKLTSNLIFTNVIIKLLISYEQSKDAKNNLNDLIEYFKTNYIEKQKDELLQNCSEFNNLNDEILKYKNIIYIGNDQYKVGEITDKADKKYCLVKLNKKIEFV